MQTHGTAPSNDEWDRFWSKVQQQGECWVWVAGRSDGYGTFGCGHAGVRKGRTKLAHRIAYEWIVGVIPAGMTLDHLCRNRACVNPAHHEPVTSAENVLRGEGVTARNARKTHCLNGHRLDGENLMNTGSKGRHCLTCRRERQQSNRAAQWRPNERQRLALEALKAAGGRSTIHQMVRAGLLAVDPTKVDRFGRESDRGGWGQTFRALASHGLVESVYQFDDPAGAAKVWILRADNEGPSRA